MDEKISTDNVIFLFSSDWFYSLIGGDDLWGALECSSRDCVRVSARECVKEMMRGADSYYLISFDEGRIDATYSAFIGRIDRSEKSAKCSGLVSLVSSLRNFDGHDRYIGWYICSLLSCALPVVNDGHVFSDALKVAAWVGAASEVYANRSGEWDVYLDSLFDDLGSVVFDFCVSDFFSALLLSVLFRRMTAISKEDRLSVWQSVCDAGPKVGLPFMPYVELEDAFCRHMQLDFHGAP